MALSKNRYVDKYPSIAIHTWAYEFADDKNQPVSLGCFESFAKEFESGQLSYNAFLDGALSHITRGIRHPEDSNLTNLAALSKCGPMGPVAAAIKLCMLCDESDFSKEVIDVLRRIDLTSSAQLLRSALPTNLPPLQLQIVVVAALRQGLPGLATDILSAGPEPPGKSLFNLFNCELCPCLFPQYYERAPPTFWVSALRARWLAPSPGLAENAVQIGPSGGPVVRALLDDPALDITLVPPYAHKPLYQILVAQISIKQEDPSLLRDVLARLPADEKLNPEILRWAVTDRSQGGAEILALLLDYRDGDGCGLDINYRVKTRVSPSVMLDVWGGDMWYQVSMTALSKAAENGNEDAVRFLISRGADVNEPEYFDKTARDLALKAGHKKVARLLGEAAKKDSDQGRCAMM
ncbi:hypothetical protein F5Y03DRAFT_401864 [Xylaria venustula]|nr:hypothetical protein F5Y03DRAFT_401864 [Xylaria venustula]